jgi:hypothetical protein
MLLTGGACGVYLLRNSSLPQQHLNSAVSYKLERSRTKLDLSTKELLDLSTL